MVFLAGKVRPTSSGRALPLAARLTMLKLIGVIHDSWIVEKWRTVAWQYARHLRVPQTPPSISIHIRPPFTQTSYRLILSEPSDSLRAVTMFSTTNPWGRLALPDPAPTIVDLGANNGFSCLYWRVRFPEASIYGIEMDPSNVELCRQLFKVNRLKGCFVQQAVGAYDGSITYRPHASHTRNRLTDLCDNSYEYGDETVEVSCQTLATVLPSLGISSVDLLKVDIEGAEQFLLDSIQEWTHLVQSMLLELHHNIDVKWARARLEAAGFKIVSADEHERTEWYCVRPASRPCKV